MNPSLPYVLVIVTQGDGTEDPGKRVTTHRFASNEIARQAAEFIVTSTGYLGGVAWGIFHDTQEQTE